MDLDLMKRLALAITEQFGDNSEVVVHDLKGGDAEHTIVAIENGHVSGRKVGDGASQVVLEQMKTVDAQPEDHLGYLTRTPDGQILKSSTLYIRNSRGRVSAILAINYDISSLAMVERAVHDLISTAEPQPAEPEKIINVNDLLEDLIAQSVALVGKPVAMMNKEDKVQAIRFLNDSGAFLITKSGARVCSYFGISKYTLYSYLDEAKTE